MKNRLLIISLRIVMLAALLSILASALFPYPVFASSITYTVRFTAAYVSGNTGIKSVYYVLDGGSAQLLGTVSSSSSLDISFNATFSNSIRVYVSIGDDAIYNEHLYINSNLGSNGNVGNSGLTYTRNDTTAPSGRIVSPISGAIIRKCPMLVVANVADDSSGVQWVIYTVKYDGVWHQIGTDSAASGVEGWSTPWDCSNVADQNVELAISAMDNAGNQGNILGGKVEITLQKGEPTAQPSSTLAPSATALPAQPTSSPVPTAAPSATLVPPTAAPPPSATPLPAKIVEATQTPVKTETPVPSAVVQATPSTTAPGRVPVCTAAFAPMMIGLGLTLWKKHYPDRRRPK